MDIWSLGLVGAAVFCIGMLAMWKFKKRMTPEERAVYDVAYAEARKEALVQKAIEDAQRSATAGGIGGSLQSIGEGFANLQAEGREMGLPSLMDYDRDDKK